MTSSSCPFCDTAPKQVFLDTGLVQAVWDAFPVSPGHALIVPKRHVATWFETNEEEQAAVLDAIAKVRDILEERFSPDGFNIGFNSGESAGQTVFHFHLHVIPRYQGDTPDPIGGVRNVIPGKGNYTLGDNDPNLELLHLPHNRALIRGSDDPLLPHLRAEFDLAVQADLNVAFIQQSGLRAIGEHLRDVLNRGGHIRLLTGDYMGITSPAALFELLDIQDQTEGKLELRVFETARSHEASFHPKAYIFKRANDTGVAYIGSSNLTKTALQRGVEWNCRVVSSSSSNEYQDVTAAFDALFGHPATRPIDQEWIRSYQSRRQINKTTPAEVEVPLELPAVPPAPHEIQAEALQALEETRQQGNSAGLVVLATGLGKTWLAAFDSDRETYQRILFVAHREEILNQAMSTFRRIRPNARLGRYTGTEKTPDADILFASIQTIGRQRHLGQFQADVFDYIIVDEFHHALATTYRRLIGHFTPKFLLGLTATPERMDGGNLLQLCQQNLVIRRDVLDGIRAGLLCPFQYFGVPDEVDYENIPWRSSRFDEEILTRAVATQTRAQNALEQHRRHGGSRALAFCCSLTHADFMSDYFQKAGVRSVAVHSGESSAPRASSLERLNAGELDVIFCVDMFNEGVDLPLVDTVIMLRPTLSSVVWLQQFGRGLRSQDGKDHLRVIDYIGNHKTFLVKIRTLLTATCGESTSDSQIAAALKRLQGGELDLPDGCDISYELEAIDIIQGLVKPPGDQEVILGYYADYQQRHGQRPTAVELFHDGYSPGSVRKRFESWFGFIDEMGHLSDEHRKVLEQHGHFLKHLEVTKMTKSYKMLVLRSLLNTDSLPGEMSIGALTEEFGRLVRASAVLQEDVGGSSKDVGRLEKLIEDNPIQAWASGKDAGSTPFFDYDGEQFQSAFGVDSELRIPFQEMVREIVDWRLAQYLERPNSPSKSDGRFVCKIIHTDQRPIIKLPDREKVSGVPEGWTDILIDGERYEGNFVKVFLNVVRRKGEEGNALPSILRAWFGADVGLPGTRFEIALESHDSGYRLSPIGIIGIDEENAQRKLWQHYMRKDIPPLFGEVFNTGAWRQGFVSRNKRLFLLVTLDKSQIQAEHQYDDGFVSPTIFKWQSQNRTSQSSSHGQAIRNHQAKEISVHLFVRRQSKVNNKAAPFVYCGELDFVDWAGERPISVTWKLRDAVPASLHDMFDVPTEA